ncbi:MAG: glycosyltransferase [Thermaerobacter sp.]|nr:glycosyltransferase [Thermaerobacter sp.]
MSRPQVLVIGHYPLERLDRAPKVRIYEMASALAHYATVTLVAGSRRDRARRLRGVAAGILPRVDLVYVESASSTATPTDLWFLARVRQRRIPLAVYVRDAYQRFPDLYPARTAKEKLLAALYGVSLAAYNGLATQVFVPTPGLAAVVRSPHPALLPPGGRPYPRPPGPPPDPCQVLYVGAGGPYDGVDGLLEAMQQVRATEPRARLTLVMRRPEWPLSKVPDGVELVEAAGPELAPYLWRAGLAVIPRPDTAYNRLALPVKLLDYWSHGLPVVVTGPSAAASLTESAGAGLAVPASVEGIAAGLTRLMGDPAMRAGFAAGALAAVAGPHHWDRRAEAVLALLTGKRGDDGR